MSSGDATQTSKNLSKESNDSDGPKKPNSDENDSPRSNSGSLDAKTEADSSSFKTAASNASTPVSEETAPSDDHVISSGRNQGPPQNQQKGGPTTQKQRLYQKRGGENFGANYAQNSQYKFQNGVQNFQNSARNGPRRGPGGVNLTAGSSYPPFYYFRQFSNGPHYQPQRGAPVGPPRFYGPRPFGGPFRQQSFGPLVAPVPPYPQQPGRVHQSRRHFSEHEMTYNNNNQRRYRNSSSNGSKDNLRSKNRVKSKSINRNRSSHSETILFDEYNEETLEYEEPFSDEEENENEEEEVKKVKDNGLTLPVPRKRIRTLSGMVPLIGYSPAWGGPTMCLMCLEFFDLHEQTEQYVEHLLSKHRIVVTDIELIVDLKRYIEYWRHRFGIEPIEKIFSEITPDKDDPLFGKVEKYYLMSEKLPEDMKIRERLAMRRLEEVLSCQQREREDQTFDRHCLFCRYQAKGNRSKLIHHLYMIHHLNLGSPDNLVFVSEYLDVLEDKLRNGICIYCEKQFSDQNSLNEHMRKKGHREVNPNNNYYDKFYVINYLELGKKWIEVLAEDFEDTMPTFQDSEEEEEEESWNEWQEDNLDDDGNPILCLFCDETFTELNILLSHLKANHHLFDLKKIITDEKMSFYDRVKFVNYIRFANHKCFCYACGKDDLNSWPALRKHLSESSDDHLSKIPLREKWDKEEFLIPTYENDSLLCALDEFDDSSNEKALPDDPAILDNGPVLDKDDVIDDDCFGGYPEENSTDSAVVAMATAPSNGNSPKKNVSSSRTPVKILPEDPVDLSYTILNDKELREQLQ